MTYLWLIGGVILGSIISNLLFYFRSQTGVLKVDRSRDEVDIYRIELGGLIKPKTKKYILKVKDDDLSQ